MGAARSNPPTPERSVGAGVWVNKLLVVKKGLINTIINTIHGPGARGVESLEASTWAPGDSPSVPRGIPGDSPRGILGRGLGLGLGR